MENSAPRSSTPSLIQSVLLRIFFVATISVAIVSGIAYGYVYNQSTKEALHELEEFVAGRVRTDSAIFELAEDNLAVFSREYLRLYLSDIKVTEADFWALYFTDDNGATRMKREFFDGLYSPDGSYRYGMSSFIGNNQPIDDPDFRRRLVLAYRLLAQLGPAWVNRFDNVHTSFPENAIVLFWPQEAWGLNARADLPMNELGTIKATLQSDNPARNPIWTGLYYDETAQTWMITYEVPVDHQGRHLINPSHDLVLTDLMERLISDTPEGGHNFIIRKDGYLIAHPSDPTQEQRWIGQLSLDKIGIPAVTQAYALITAQMGNGAAGVQIIKNQAGDSYLAVSELQGPDWWFVSVFPTQNIKTVAHQAAFTVFAEGMLLLALILAVVYLVMRAQAAKPLRQLRYAAEAIGEGKYNEVADAQIALPIDLKNEVGLLATRIVEMADKIRYSRRNLERIVEERTRELEAANASLREMSLLDGLTNIHNRRSFDRNMASVFADARAGLGEFSLLIADIDEFKLYNDTHGHTEGDRILKQIAKTIQDQIREEDRVYRLGGEEFAIIFNHADAPSAEVSAQRVLGCIRDLQIAHRESSHGVVTMSAGLAQYSDEFASPEQLIKLADDRLYLSKGAGRNRLTA